MATHAMMRSSTVRSLLVAAALLAACGGKAGASADGSVLGTYLAIGEALAADQVPAPELSAQITQAAGSLEGKPGAEAIAQGAAGITREDLEAARAAFKTMSDGMIEYLQASADQQPGHTIVHCPMTFGGKGGLWVQRTGKVMNPYEGSRMLHCGDKLGWGDALPST